MYQDVLSNRWPWALLEASQVYAYDALKLDMIESIKVLSGVEAKVLEGDSLKERLKDENARKELCEWPPII
jgi:hypothetical protein